MLTITHTTKNSNDVDLIHSIKIQDSTVRVYMSIFNSPFYNCQTFSIAGADELLRNFTTDEIIEVFNYVEKICEKRQFVIDTYDYHSKIIHELFEVVGKITYKNTSSHKEMCLFLLRFK